MAQGKEHKPNDALRNQVKLWSAAGLTQERVAALMGLSVPTLMKHYREEYEGGVDEMVSELFKVSYGVAKDVDHKDSSRERQFLLKTRGGYSEKQQVEHSGGVTIERVMYGKDTDSQ